MKLANAEPRARGVKRTAIFKRDNQQGPVV